jgi:predicted enzyme related to lactoylglutathione lyase
MTDGDPSGTASDDGDHPRARLVGINHVALTVGDLDAALEWYDALFSVELRGRSPSMAFVDAGDQFLAFNEVADGSVDDVRHVGLVVDDAAAVESRLDAVDAERLATPHFDVRDPWGNRLQIVEYREVQFTKAAHVLAGMGLDPEADDLAKTAGALAELDAKGMAPPDAPE